jgi:hypothetical protein
MLVFVQTLILLLDTDEDEFTQLKVILEPCGNVLPSAGDDNVGGAGSASVTVIAL